MRQTFYNNTLLEVPLLEKYLSEECPSDSFEINLIHPEIMYYKYNHDWKQLFPNKKYKKFLEQTIEEKWILSGDDFVHLDIYPVAPDAPTLIFCHGLSTCGRMMGHLVKDFYEEGYNVVCPDLKGFGLSPNKRGSGKVSEFVQNLMDVIEYVKKRFNGPRFMAGISMGGGLSYYVAAAGGALNAIASLNLLDFSDENTMNILSDHELIHKAVKKIAKSMLYLGSQLIPEAYVPIGPFVKSNQISESPQVVQLFQTHPLVTKAYTVESLCSFLQSAPPIPFEKFDRIPVMALHDENDKFISESMSRENFEKLPGKKEYVRLKGCGHIPYKRRSVKRIFDAMDYWFKKWM